MKLLKQLFEIHSPSGNEKRIRKFIRRWIKSNVPGCAVQGDRYGNLYITKGRAETYPCLTAHLDQVQRPYPKDYMLIENPWYIMAYSPAKRATCGLGGDDKCGIWIALNMLREAPAIKVAFFAAEETGCQGSSKADMSFFDDTRFVVEADRRGAYDLITEIGRGRLCSDEFIAAIQPELFGYKETQGLMTDVEALRRNGYPNSCINISCGYYEPHTDHEYVVKDDLFNALNFVRHIVANAKEVYKHEDKRDVYGYNDDYYSNRWAYDIREDEMYDLLDYNDYDPTLSTDAIYNDIRDLTTLSKGKVMSIIDEWKSWNLK